MTETLPETEPYPVGTEMLRLHGVSGPILEWARGTTTAVEFDGVTQPVRTVVNFLMGLPKEKPSFDQFAEGAQRILNAYQQRE